MITMWGWVLGFGVWLAIVLLALAILPCRADRRKLKTKVRDLQRQISAHHLELSAITGIAAGVEGWQDILPESTAGWEALILRHRFQVLHQTIRTYAPAGGGLILGKAAEEDQRIRRHITQIAMRDLT